MYFYEFKTNRVYKHIYEFTKHLIHNQQKAKELGNVFMKKTSKRLHCSCV